MTERLADHAAAAGRSCPLDYRYAPHVFARPAEFACEVLYVVGGLYGNPLALDRVLSLFERERGDKRLVFNGDFHWFDVDPGTFARVQRHVLAFDALRGNVETELAAEASDAGCGCAYPGWVDDGTVERSNRILQRLRTTARQHGGAVGPLGALSMHARVDVADLRVAVVHGDAESLSGWGFALESLRAVDHRERVRGWFDEARVDAFACSHTCLPVFAALPSRHRATPPLVLNNGAAGLPNFRGRGEGLLTRIALRPFDGPERRDGLVRRTAHAAVHIDAIAIDIDAARWQRRFLANWPEGSDAHRSYWSRIVHGPAHAPVDAWQAEMR